MTMALLPNKLKGNRLIPPKSANILKEKLRQFFGQLKAIVRQAADS